MVELLERARRKLAGKLSVSAMFVPLFTVEFMGAEEESRRRCGGVAYTTEIGRGGHGMQHMIYSRILTRRETKKDSREGSSPLPYVVGQ